MARFLRFLFFLLVLANLLFFAWGRGYLGATEDGREPQRFSNQMEPGKLRAISIDPQAVVTPEAAEACRLVNGLTLADAQRLQAQVQAEGKMPGLKLAVKPVEIPPGHWVFIPPQPNRTAADKKLAELKRRGIANYFLVLDEGIDKLAISLGMFSSQKSADDYLNVLAGKGIKSAIVQLRTPPPEKAQLEVRGVQELLLKRLPELLAGVPDASIAECAGNK